MLAFLGHRGVIDDQYRIAAADKPIRLNEQFPLQRRQIPDTTSNKVMQLIIVVRRKTFRHWLNALAITGPDQPRRWCRDLCWNWVTRSPAFREYRVRPRRQLADRWWQAS